MLVLVRARAKLVAWFVVVGSRELLSVTPTTVTCWRLVLSRILVVLCLLCILLGKTSAMELEELRVPV